MIDDKSGHKTHSKPVPYNTGKVLIGSRYEPSRRYEISRDAEIIQAALLGHRRNRLFKKGFVFYVILAVIVLVWMVMPS